MADRNDLVSWLKEALDALGGSASIVEICRHVWETRRSELERSGDLFYTWQYDIRWAATKLRQAGVIKPANESPSGVWELV